ncbi:MAG: amidohydrolase family protein [Myxococcales bacterium]|nr:amidohydrolase family protein [Myxococcales bacterium]
MKVDVLIQGGTVVDGTGTPARVADVALVGGRIAAVGTADAPRLDVEAARVIDATGLLVTPGFVDVHTHYDGQVSWDGEMAPSVFHGVTTAVIGNCGVGFAPARPADHQRLIDLMQGVEDIPGSALHEGLTWDWESFPDYLDAIDRVPRTLDVLAQVPHDPLRVYVMGERALAGEAATEADVAEMRRLLREALLAGASGFSTGRSDNHKDVHGRDTPAAIAAASELAGIAQAFRGLDHGVLSAVSDFDLNQGKDCFEREFDVLEAMAEASGGRPFSVSLIQRIKDTEEWRRILRRAEAASARGVPMRAQVASRGIGVILGLDATFHPFLGFPTYKALAHLPLSERVARLREPAVKAQILGETPDKLSGDGSSVPPLADQLLGNLDFVAMRLWPLTDGFDYEPKLSESLLARAMGRGQTTLECLYDALLEEDGRALLYFPIFNYLAGNLDVVGEMLHHPLALPGLTDGGAHVGTICDASMPTFLLSYWTRDRQKNPLSIERAIQMLTADGADHLGLGDRGRLVPGQRADVNLIDHATLQLRKPRLVADLPAGGKRFLQDAVGYRATFVAGVETVRDGQLTGARPGRVVRLGHPPAS